MILVKNNYSVVIHFTLVFHARSSLPSCALTFLTIITQNLGNCVDKINNNGLYLLIVLFCFSPIEHCLDFSIQRLWLFDIAFTLFFLFYFLLRVSRRLSPQLIMMIILILFHLFNSTPPACVRSFPMFAFQKGMF